MRRKSGWSMVISVNALGEKFCWVIRCSRIINPAKKQAQPTFLTNIEILDF